jgi:predicted membrane-bound dolichyl-phosphate-mannose-protein mannosyltransferase
MVKLRERPMVWKMPSVVKASPAKAMATVPADAVITPPIEASASTSASSVVRPFRTNSW